MAGTNSGEQFNPQVTLSLHELEGLKGEIADLKSVVLDQQAEIDRLKKALEAYRQPAPNVEPYRPTDGGMGL